MGRWSCSSTATRRSGTSGRIRWPRWAATIWPSASLYPDDDHWVMLEKHTQVARDIRGFIDGKDFPKESVYRADAR
jgi:hypothetical protein